MRPGALHKHCDCTVYLDTKIAVVKAKVLPHLEACVGVKRGISHAKSKKPLKKVCTVPTIEAGTKLST
jgi:hypothetical protein